MTETKIIQCNILVAAVAPIRQTQNNNMLITDSVFVDLFLFSMCYLLLFWLLHYTYSKLLIGENNTEAVIWCVLLGTGTLIRIIVIICHFLITRSIQLVYMHKSHFAASPCMYCIGRHDVRHMHEGAYEGRPTGLWGWKYFLIWKLLINWRWTES